MHARVSSAPGRPAVVLVHGLVISSVYMVPTARRLAADFDVYCPDLPGFGKSAKPRQALTISQLADSLKAFLDVVNVDRPALVGNSMGCQIIADLASRFPERIGCLVLGGPTVDRSGRSKLVQTGRLLLDVPLEHPSLIPTHIRDHFRAGPRRAFRTFQYAINDRIEDKLPKVTAPTLVVRGSRDPIVPQRWAEEVASLLPNGSLRVLEGGPHALNYSSASEFARIVRVFVMKCEAAK